MSHDIRKINIGNSALVESTIIDYVQGGEAYTLAELGIVGPVTRVLFIEQVAFLPLASDPKGIVPIFQNNKIVLTSWPGSEIPSTVGINYVILAVIHGQ